MTLSKSATVNEDVMRSDETFFASMLRSFFSEPDTEGNEPEPHRYFGAKGSMRFDVVILSRIPYLITSIKLFAVCCMREHKTVKDIKKLL